MILHVKTITTNRDNMQDVLISRAKNFVEHSTLPNGVYKFILGYNTNRHYVKIYKLDNETDVKEFLCKHDRPINYVKSTLNFSK